jgi:hypothetical protein
MKFIIALIALIPYSISAQSSDVLKVHKSQIEALESIDGSYTRFEDLNDGFVDIYGVKTSNDSILLELKNTDLNSVILKDGVRLNKTLLLQMAAVIGGDMGGGGTAH